MPFKRDVLFLFLAFIFFSVQVMHAYPQGNADSTSIVANSTNVTPWLSNIGTLIGNSLSRFHDSIQGFFVQTPAENLFNAVSSNNVSAIEDILGVQPELVNAVRSGTEETLLSHAILENKPQIALFLIEKGALIDEKDRMCGATPLVFAADMNQTEVAKRLIENDANINAANNDGTTVLMRAASRQNLELVEILVRMGANVGAVNTYGLTALNYAKHNKSSRTIREKIIKALELKENNQNDHVWMLA